MTPEAQAISFHKLKPTCVQIVQTIAGFRKSRTGVAQIFDGLATLQQAIQELGPEALNIHLADYVFFPLTHVFRESSRLPYYATEKALCCVSSLLEYGWNRDAPLLLCKELLALLSFFLAGSEIGQQRAEAAPVEVKLKAIECLRSMFLFCQEPVNKMCRDPSDEIISVLGKSTSSILDTIKDVQSPPLQIIASEAISSLIACLKGSSMLYRFLPGIVSSLSQVINPRVQIRRPYRTLVASIDALRTVLQAVSFTSEVNVPAGLTTSDEWLRANSAQLRVAIAMVVKVREHERVEVRQALLQLCKIILDDLGKPLEDLRGLLLETILILGALELTIRDSRTYQEIKDMISAHDLLPDQLRAVLHSWISKLPSVAEGTDENQTQSLLSQISVAHRICRDLDFDISFLHRTLLKHLLWSVDYCLQTAKSLSSGFVGIREIEGSQQLISMLDKGHLQAEVFPNLSIKHSLPIGCLQTFVHDLARNGPAMEYLQELAAEIVSRNDDNLPAILWLIARISVACGQGASANHDGGLISSTVTDTLSIAYSRSVDVLTSGVHRMNDWKLEALSLEIISIHACQLLEGVELDLVDVLLPVIERIDSPQPELRNAAMSCLEVLTSACGAASPSTLVVQNADYLVNALSLKFHAFNIDHQSPRVLVMIIELCGSGIVPYLDDIVDSLISTIAAYHGYPKIVASLFMVLDAIVRLVNIPAINSKQSKRAVYMRPVSCRYVQVQDIPSIIEQTKSLSGNGTVADRGSPCESENQAGADYTDKDSLHAHPVAQPPHRITAVALSIIRSAQHHLTSEVPGIRLQLLSMVMAGCRALSDMRDDDMLPLLNDIWPVIYRRIYDADSNVKIAAMETLDILFQSSGDFLSSRVQNEWHKIRDLASETRSRLNVRINGSAYRGDFTEARRTWEALLNMLISLMRYLRLTAEMEDGLIDLLTPYSHEHSPLRLALQGMNPDAQWLSGFLSGRLHRDGASTRVPQLHGFTFKDPRSVH